MEKKTKIRLAGLIILATAVLSLILVLFTDSWPLAIAIAVVVMASASAGFYWYSRRPHRQFLGLLLEPRWQQLWFRADRHRVRCRRRRRGVGCGQHNAWRSQLPVVDTSERRRAPDAWEHVLLRRVHDQSHQLRPRLGHAQRLSGGIDAHRCADK